MKFILSIFFLFSTASAQATTLISDLDDTIKQTWVGNIRESIKNGLFSTTPFGGMADLYNELGNKFYVVSGSPKVIRLLIQNFLRQGGFPKGEIFLRKNIFSDTVKFKIDTISGIINKTSDVVILIGDDTEKDPEIFLALKTRFQEKIAAIYIRRVSGRPLPAGVTGFFHPLEVATHEWGSSRLSDTQIMALAQGSDFEFSLSPHLYYPKYVVCPQLERLFDFTEAEQSNFLDLQDAVAAAKTHSTAYCLR